MGPVFRGFLRIVAGGGARRAQVDAINAGEKLVVELGGTQASVDGKEDLANLLVSADGPHDRQVADKALVKTPASLWSSVWRLPRLRVVRQPGKQLLEVANDGLLPHLCQRRRKHVSDDHGATLFKCGNNFVSKVVVGKGHTANSNWGALRKTRNKRVRGVAKKERTSKPTSLIRLGGGGPSAASAILRAEEENNYFCPTERTKPKIKACIKFKISSASSALGV